MDGSRFYTHHKHQAPTENRHLLANMERNQFIHSNNSPFKTFVPKQPSTSHKFKKPKRNFKSDSIPFYQSSKFQHPTNNNPRPKKPYWPKVYTVKKNISSYASRINSSSTYTPSLINPSDSKKYLEFLKNVQPGINTYPQGQVDKWIRAARWEGMVSHLGKLYSGPLMGEFYTNMRIIKGVEGELHFTTSINKKTIMIDHKTINKALHLPSKLCDLPCLDIYSHFVFNKGEFQAMLSVFTNSDVPNGLCTENCGIHYKHFIPAYQNLALILRVNIVPKFNQSKYFDFFDMKVMFLLSLNKINFSVSYIILLNMVNANLLDYMPYGLLISSIFDIFHIAMDEKLVTMSDSFLSHVHIKSRVPLICCEPRVVSPTVIPNVIREEDINLAKIESVKMVIEELKSEVRRLKNENLEIKGRLSYIEGLAPAFNQNAKGFSDLREMEVISSFQVKLVDDTVMVDKFESVGVGIGAQGIESLPEINDEFGFVVVVHNGASCSGRK